MAVQRLIGRIIAAVLASTVLLLAWGMLYWQFIYEPLDIYHTLPDGDAVAALLQQSGTQTGTYFYPWPRNTPETMQRFVEQHTQGPFFKLSFVREGVNPQSPQKMLGGVAHYIVVSFMACLLIVLLHPAQLSVMRKTAILLLAGALGTVFIQIGDPVWFHLPWDYSLGILVYEMISWAIAAIVIAKIVRT